MKINHNQLIVISRLFYDRCEVEETNLRSPFGEPTLAVRSEGSNVSYLVSAAGKWVRMDDEGAAGECGGIDSLSPRGEK